MLRSSNEISRNLGSIKVRGKRNLILITICLNVLNYPSNPVFRAHFFKKTKNSLSFNYYSRPCDFEHCTK
jgi:hypothetical protein